MLQKLKNYYHFLHALVWAIIFNFPSNKLTVIGVTGTDGKTTTANMIYQILTSAGKKVSIVSSIGAKIGELTVDTGFHVTTPSPYNVQRLLKKAHDFGSQYLVLEATSHGLDQNRLAFIKFEMAVITNITQDHFDYHKSKEKYQIAKAKLFQNTNYSILNKDDSSFNFLKNNSSGKLITYSKEQNADYNLANFPVNLSIIGTYNISNALAAAAAASVLKIPKSKILTSLKSFIAPAGRMQEVNLGQNFKVFIDFAHTPNSFEKALSTLKGQKNASNKLIAVFGSAGQRDKSKRPKMGKIAADLADFMIITAEDPRGEKVEDISGQIISGIVGKKQGRDYQLVSDRQEAINLAVERAKNGDIVAILGKGHEKSMTIGKKEYPWNEYKTVLEAIKGRLDERK